MTQPSPADASAAAPGEPVLGAAYRPSGFRGRVVLVLLGLLAVQTVVSIGTWLVAIDLVDRLASGGAGDAEAVAFGSARELVDTVGFTLGVAAYATFVAWATRAVDNATELGGGHPWRRGSLLVVAAVVPIANAIVLARALDDADRRLVLPPGVAWPRSLYVLYAVAFGAMELLALGLQVFGSALPPDPSVLVGFAGSQIARAVLGLVWIVLEAAIVQRIAILTSRRAAIAEEALPEPDA